MNSASVFSSLRSRRWMQRSVAYASRREDAYSVWTADISAEAPSVAEVPDRRKDVSDSKGNLSIQVRFVAEDRVVIGAWWNWGDWTERGGMCRHGHLRSLYTSNRDIYTP